MNNVAKIMQENYIDETIDTNFDNTKKKFSLMGLFKVDRH